MSTDRKGNPKPDSKLRDTENIPFTYGGNTDGDAGRAATIKAYFDAEVLPHVPDAWVDTAKAKVGYEIPFTRHFYKIFRLGPSQRSTRIWKNRSRRLWTCCGRSSSERCR